MIVLGSPADGKLHMGDELLQVKDEYQCWTTHKEMEQGIRGSKYKVGVCWRNLSLEYELTKELTRDLDTYTDQAKSDKRVFMT